MKMLIKTVVLLILCTIGTTKCDGYYTIVASESIRPHSDYQVSVTVHNQTEPVRVKLSVKDDKSYEKFTEVTLVNNQTRLAVIHLDAFAVNGNYKFVAEGLSGLIFKDATSLNVESKNCSIFIQTDKALYKPGEAIRFRVIVLNFRLQPIDLESGQLNVWIKDADKNRLKQWKKVEVHKGVFADELQLSDYPVLGDWTIHAEVGEESRQKTVQVAKHILPIFDVQIDSLDHYHVKDDKVRIVIRSKYTYGKLLIGNAIVSITPTKIDPWSERPKPVPIEEMVKINGSVMVEFSIMSDLNVHLGIEQESAGYEIRATVFEEFSSRNRSATKRFTVHRKRYEINAIDHSSRYETGSPVHVNVAVTYQDKKPVMVNEATKEIMFVKVPNNQNLSETFFKRELSANGTVQTDIPTSEIDNSGFILRAKYQDEEAEVGYYYPGQTAVSKPAKLKIKVLTKKPTLNKPIFVEVQSLDVLTYFTYQVVSQGKLIHSDSVEVPKQRNHVFQFLATFDLTPKAHLIVYYFKDDDIISSKVTIEMREELQNFVKLKLWPSRVAPGKVVNITVCSNPRSYIGLVGVDQSVLLLKTNPDITVASAFNERELYQHYFHDKENSKYGSYSPFYFNDYFAHFQSSRVILFTNARKDETPGKFNKLGNSSVESALAIGVGGTRPGPGTSLEFNRRPPLPDEGVPTAPRIRKDFSETWLWQSIDDDNFNGTISLESRVPDTITSWVVSAFALNPITGLGLMETPPVLEVFQPFFVSVNLPYSIKRGEILFVPVTVYNYLESDVDAKITLHNENDEFKFMTDLFSKEKVRKRWRHVASNGGALVSFVIKPKKIGLISIKVTVESPLAGDGIVRILHVEPEGIAQFSNVPVFVDLRDTPSLDVTIETELAVGAVADSVRLEYTCIGDLLGGTIKNAKRLIRLPTGCGEQNMLNFVSNIVILNYLRVTDQSKPDIEAKVKQYTEKGYQRELNYRHGDGSFSAFGKSDRNGSTWLTAFVSKSFRQAAEHIDVDENIIGKALKWLSKVQNEDGSFPEVGQVSHKDLQGGSSRGIAMTAYVLTAFLENEHKFPGYDDTIDKAIQNIVAGLRSNNDVYAIALAAYALELADHEMKQEILDQILAKSMKKDGRSWLTKGGRSPKTLNVEMTAYVLLTLLHSEQYENGLPFFKFLLHQRNDRGGFQATQDTVVGLQALAKYAERISVKDNNIDILVSSIETNETRINVNSENALVLQTFELPPTVRSIDVSANGTGFALFQLSLHYYSNITDTESSFKINSKLQEKSSDAHLNMEVCVSYNPNGDEVNDIQSNMAVLEISLPTGFIAESDLLNNLSEDPNVKKVETKDGDSVIVLYFDNLKMDKPECLLVEAYRAYIVAEQKPVPIVVYDYYDSSKHARQFYTIPTKTLCDICEGDDCSERCKRSNHDKP